MLLIMGKLRLKKRLGRVADFCSVCRNVMPFGAAKLREVSHLYFIPLGSGKVLGTEIRCEACLTRYLTLRAYAGASKDRRADVPTLAELSFPFLLEHAEEKAAVEHRASEGGLTLAERRELIASEIGMLEYHARWAFGVDVRKWISIVVFIMMIPFGMVAAIMWNDPNVLLVVKLFMSGVMLAATAWLLYEFITCRRRVGRRRVMPRLVRALAYLRPTRAELAAAMGDVRTTGRQIWRFVSAERLGDALEKAGVLGE